MNNIFSTDFWFKSKKMLRLEGDKGVFIGDNLTFMKLENCRILGVNGLDK